MSTDADATAVQAFPELAHLIMLREANWCFLPVHTVDGEPVQLDGFRAWPDEWADGIRIRSGTDALGIRTAPGEPPAITWEYAGTLAEVVSGLLALPAPGERLAPRLVVGSAPLLWTP